MTRTVFLPPDPRPVRLWRRLYLGCRVWRNGDRVDESFLADVERTAGVHRAHRDQFRRWVASHPEDAVIVFPELPKRLRRVLCLLAISPLIATDQTFDAGTSATA